MRNWRAKLGKLRNGKCETTVCVNEHQREDNERSNRRPCAFYCCSLVPGNESSSERKYQGAKVPPMVLSLLGAKVRGNESSIIPHKTCKIVQVPEWAIADDRNYGTFVPTYFRSQERKYHRWNFRPLVLSLPGTFAP